MATADARQRGALPNPDVATYEAVNRDVLKVLSRPGKGWWVLFAMAAAGCRALPGIVVLPDLPGHRRLRPERSRRMGRVYHHLRVLGRYRPLGHADFSHPLPLPGPWRQAIYRASEAMTVFAVMTAGLFPLIHVGRVWHAYWLIPYPQLAIPVAELPVAARLGRFCDHDLLYRFGGLLLPGDDPRPGGGA